MNREIDAVRGCEQENESPCETSVCVFLRVGEIPENI